MEGKNSAYTKLYNRRRVLELLQQRPMSRADLARELGLTRAAVTLIAEELMASGLVQESTKSVHAPGPGRTPTGLELRRGALYAVGISLGRKTVQVGIEDLCGTVIARALVAQHDPEGLITAVKALLAQTAIPKEKLLGIGISAPGPVDSQTGTILNPPDFSRWTQCPICSILSQALDLPAYLENDANAAALFNRRSCDFPEKDNFLLLYINCGVGSGVISQGKLLPSCELGHSSIDFNGPVCSCGNRGCLEMYASLNELLKKFPQYDSWEALMASKHTEQALSLEADYLAAAIVSFSNVVPIGAVLFSGKLQRWSQALIPLIEERIAGRSLSGSPIRLMSALFDETTPVQSACSIVFGRYLGTHQS